MSSMRLQFTDRSRTVLALAREEAVALQHGYLATEHILLGLLREGGGVAIAVLRDQQVDLELVRQRIHGAVRRGSAPVTIRELPSTNRTKSVLEYAVQEARQMNHTYIGTEHLLLGLLREDRAIAAQVLQSLNVTYDSIRGETDKLLGYDRAGDPD